MKNAGKKSKSGKHWKEIVLQNWYPLLVDIIDEGEAGKITPKAFFRQLLGYSKPFDRHDWVVDRCGQQVVYVIDFYRGKQYCFCREMQILIV
jgi:hypothetical protein